MTDLGLPRERANVNEPIRMRGEKNGWREGEDGGEDVTLCVTCFLHMVGCMTPFKYNWMPLTIRVRSRDSKRHHELGFHHLKQKKEKVSENGRLGANGHSSSFVC